MRRSVSFWGTVLIVLGALLLLENIGIFGNFSIWGLFWPLLLIAFGVWVLLGVFYGRGRVETEPASILLEGASEARIKFQHGAGRLNVSAGAGPGQLLSGDFGGGLDYTARRDGDALDVKTRMGRDGWTVLGLPLNWGAGGGLDWDVRLTGEIPLSLKFETGASESRLDLSELRVTDLKVETGASATYITLPANAGHTEAKVASGAASLSIRVPEGVAARIRVESGLAGISINRERFPRSGNVYQSPDYETAANKVNIKIETGVGSVDVA